MYCIIVTIYSASLFTIFSVYSVTDYISLASDLPYQFPALLLSCPLYSSTIRKDPPHGLCRQQRKNISSRSFEPLYDFLQINNSSFLKPAAGSYSRSDYCPFPVARPPGFGSTWAIGE